MAYLSAHGLVLANNVSITLVSAICQYIPDFFFLIFSRTFLSLKCSEIRKKFFPGVFCIGKWKKVFSRRLLHWQMVPEGHGHLCGFRNNRCQR